MRTCRGCRTREIYSTIRLMHSTNGTRRSKSFAPARGGPSQFPSQALFGKPSFWRSSATVFSRRWIRGCSIPSHPPTSPS